MTQGQRGALFSYLMTFVLAIFIAGCSGGGGGDAPPADPDSQNNTPDDGNDLPDVPRIDVSSVVINPKPIAMDIIDLASVNTTAANVNHPVEFDASKWTTSAGDPLAYSWSFLAKPDGSTAELQNATSAVVSFSADKYGAYLVQMEVSADDVSKRDVAIALVYNTEDTNYTDSESYKHHGLRSQCDFCHGGEDQTGNGGIIAPKSGDHIATSNMCQTCHTSFGFGVIPYVDHQEVFGSCSECHNGVLAVGKSANHVETEAQCDDCHNTNDFVDRNPDGSFDHSNTETACVACHNGNFIIGKHEGHAETSNSCNRCHTTEAFSPALVDHNNLGEKTCIECHDGTIATGKPDVPDPANHPHPVTSDDCSICHNTRSFVLVDIFDHGVLDYNVQRCDSCHNDENAPNAPGLSQDHVDILIQGTTSDFKDCGMCHNTTAFFPATYDHTGVVDGCSTDGCHDGSPDTATYKHENHMPTVEECHVCHTPGTFTSGVYDHDPLTEACKTCHDGVINVGVTVNHVPITEVQDCSDCHNDTIDFANVTFSHDGIIDNCISCHDGEIATGKSVNHVPTTGDCHICHGIQQFDTFAGATFNHDGITENCASCHDGNIATGKPRATHIPTQDDCSVCHTDTTSFAGATFDHTGIERGCEGCHDGQLAIGKTLNPKDVNYRYDHLPTDQDCYLCHNTSAFAPASNFAHVGIAGNCSSCHNGNYEAIGALPAPNTPIHTENPNTDCGACHSTSDIAPNGVSFLNAFVDHTNLVDNCARAGCHDANSTAGIYAASDAHVQTTADCALCHVSGGTWAEAVFDHSNVPDTQRCDDCHNGTDATGIVDKVNPPHAPIDGKDCRVCHNTTAFAGAKFDHTGINGGCAECHNGVTATGKHQNHVPTNKDCDACHKTTGFIPATFNHDGIVDGCSNCHDGTIATGKHVDHVPTNQDCGVCHNTTTFIPDTFNHTGIVNGCDACHDGNHKNVTGKPANHAPTNLDCHFCHTTATFVGGTWDHRDSGNDCQSCHNGTIATGKSRDHFNTDLNCDICHTTQGWVPDIFSHDPQGNYPGDHARNPGCGACHGNIVTTPFLYPSPIYAPDCAACHEGDFRRTDDHIGGNNGTVAQNKDCSGGGRGCHRVTDPNWD